MGLFQAVSGAVGGTLTDQWLDFFGVPDGGPSTAALLAVDFSEVDSIRSRVAEVTGLPVWQLGAVVPPGTNG